MDSIVKPRRAARRAYISAILAAALLSANAQAALLTNIEGAVFVNHGDGFRPAAVGLPLVPGDRVRAGIGSADIVYDNGCAARVEPHQVVVVLSEPPVCNGGGLKDGVAVAPADDSIDPIIIGGLLAGGAAGLAVALSNTNSNTNNTVNRPVSP